MNVAAKTNTEQIQEISRTISEHIPLTNFQLSEMRRELQSLADKLNEALQRVAVLEQRLAHVEKQVADAEQRRWQLLMAVLTCFFTGVIALIAAFLKK